MYGCMNVCVDGLMDVWISANEFGSQARAGMCGCIAHGRLMILLKLGHRRRSRGRRVGGYTCSCTCACT